MAWLFLQPQPLAPQNLISHAWEALLYQADDLGLQSPVVLALKYERSLKSKLQIIDTLKDFEGADT